MPLEDANISELLDGFLDRQRADNEKTLAQFRQEIDELLRDHELSEPARKSIEILADRLQNIETRVHEYNKWTRASVVLLAGLFAHAFRGNANAVNDFLSKGLSGGDPDPQVEAFRDVIVESLRKKAASSSMMQ